jgi:hypothetical protein
MLMMLQQIVAPALAEMRENLKACAEIRLRIDFDDKDVQERTRICLFPTANEAMVMRALSQLLDKMHWRAGAVSLAVVLEGIQDVVGEQLTLFPLENERERRLLEVQRYLAARFGDNRLRRVVLSHPSAPLPEWRVDWVEDDA